MSGISTFRNQTQEGRDSFLGYSFPFSPGGIASASSDANRMIFGSNNLYLRALELVGDQPIFRAVGLDLPFGNVSAVLTLNTRMIISISNVGIYFSDDNGETFTLSQNTSRVFCTGFANNNDGQIIAKIDNTNTHLVSNDNGENFSTTSITPSALFFSDEAIKYFDGYGYVAIERDGENVYTSSDLINWQTLNPNNGQLWSSEYLNNKLFLAAQNGDLISTTDNTNFTIEKTEMGKQSNPGVSLFLKALGKLDNRLYIAGSSGDKPILMKEDGNGNYLMVGVGLNPAIVSPAESSSFMIPFNGKMYTNIGGSLLFT